MRIIHSVLFSLKHKKGSPEAEAFLAESLSVLSTIGQVCGFRVYNQVSQKNKFEYAFSMVFETEEDYAAYNQNENHQNYVKTLWTNQVTDFMEVDLQAH